MRAEKSFLRIGLLILSVIILVSGGNNYAHAHEQNTDRNAWTEDYERREAESAYASSISDDMLTYIAEDAWSTGKRLACLAQDISQKPIEAQASDPLDEWVKWHLRNTPAAGELFDFDASVDTADLLNDIAIEYAARRLEQLLRPAARAYYRAKHEEALRVVELATIQGAVKQVCGAG